MKLTCSQMDVLLTFYIDGDLSASLRNQVEEHLRNCSACRAKYDIIKSMILDLKNSFDNIDEEFTNNNNSYNTQVTSQQYRLFKNDLSAYIDNELTNDENIKIKKFTINNPKARQDLEDSYNIRKLMNDSFKKIKSEARHDFSKSVLRQLELEDEATAGLHPIIKLIVVFTVTVLVISSIVLMSFSV